MNDYFTKITPLLEKLYLTPVKAYKHEPTLFSIDNSDEGIERKRIAHMVRQQDMKEGNLAQILIGNFYGWEDLGIGHYSGLDCKRTDNSMILELKNKWNTCNSNDQRALKDELVNYKLDNPGTRCIWAIINPRPHSKPSTWKTSIVHNGVTIEKIQGSELFKEVFIFEGIDYSQQVFEFVKREQQRLHEQLLSPC